MLKFTLKYLIRSYVLRSTGTILRELTLPEDGPGGPKHVGASKIF